MSAPFRPRYVVLFRTHIWDAFVARQYERLKQRIGRGDLYILLDETNGPVATGQPAVVSHTNASIEALGLAPAGGGNMLWYNGDYPLYYFYQQHPDYDYYVMTEYDVCVNTDFDSIIDGAMNAGAGLVALAKGEPVATWPHAESCQAIYPPEVVEKRLICLTALSRDAVRGLFDKRLALSAEIRAGVIRRWPFCEGFIPTELAVSGFRLLELSDFGTTDRYDWWPPVLEDDLPNLTEQTFIHPVLDRARYVDATLRIWKFPELFDPGSGLRGRLSRVPIRSYALPLVRMLLARFGRAVSRRIALAA